MMRRLFLLLAPAACCAASHAAVAQPAPPAGWMPAQIAALRHWIAVAPEDALPVLATTELDRAIAASDPGAADHAASALATKLARMHLLGSANAAGRQGWYIADSDNRIDLDARLAQALAAQPAGSAAALDRFFDEARPKQPQYAALRSALATEHDPAHRVTLALNMERWRWMPQTLGQDYVLVNAAAFEVELWRQGKLAGTWPVIVGKVKSPTPVFSTKVTGVTLNPWWEIPGNIVRESVGALVRRNPAAARRRGYVWGGGRYRQQPGPRNALGQMKLAMPNPYNVYLHDTPDKKLFARDVRAFSHGCIRVGNALGFAGSLLQGTPTADRLDELVASGRTETYPLAAALPVYVAYFTAASGSDGAVHVLPDVYGRDTRWTPDAPPEKCAC